MRSTFLPKAGTLNMFDVLFFGESSTLAGGLLLWSTQLVKVGAKSSLGLNTQNVPWGFDFEVKGNPIDRLIKEVLLEDSCVFKNWSNGKI